MVRILRLYYLAKIINNRKFNSVRNIYQLLQSNKSFNIETSKYIINSTLLPNASVIFLFSTDQFSFYLIKVILL